jgi:transcriptional regulator with XRE-family HTH domain
MENEKNSTTLSQEETLLRKLKKIASLAPYCEKPSEGWIFSLGMALGFDRSRLSQKLNMSIEEIQRLERKNKIPIGLNRIAKAFGGRFQFIFIPKNIDDIVRQDVGERFKKLSLLPQKPEKGWLKAIRKARGLSQTELAQHLNYSYYQYILQMELVDKKNKIGSTGLESILQAMDCRAELVFIPENLNFIQNAFTNGKEKIAQKKIEAQKNLKSKKHLTTSSLFKRPLFPIQFEQLALLPKRPPGGNMQMLRKIYGLTLKELAKKVGCTFQGIGAIESAEREKKVPYPPLKRIAHALGCHLNYLLVFNEDLPHDLHLDEDPGKGYYLTFQMAQQTYQVSSFPLKPAEGWIKSIRLARGLSVRELAAMAHVSCRQAYRSERFESQNIFSSQYFQKIAEALGGRFEYVLIPDKQPLPRNRSLVLLSSLPDHNLAVGA